MIKGYWFHTSTFEGTITRECLLYTYTVAELFSFVSSLTSVSPSCFLFFYIILFFHFKCSAQL